MSVSRFHQILQRFKKLERLFKLEKQQWSELALSDETKDYLNNPTLFLPVIKKAFVWQRGKDCHIIPFHHPHYPALLKEIPNPPPLLFVKGQIETLHTPQIAIVGSRNPTPVGLSLAQTFACELSQAGFTITSGLALGIDTAAHRSALREKKHTLAVLGSGINHIYPYYNKNLSEEIVKQGALISEFPLNMPPKRENFPQRNRIVSGLSIGTLVIEAGIKSGSLITARLAAEQGREVFAVPGSAMNPQAKGCHFLIQQGAKLTTNIEHVLEEFKGFDYFAHKNKNQAQSQNAKWLSVNEQKILRCLGYEPTPVELIKARSGLEITEVNHIMCDLVLKKEVASFFNGYIKIK